MPITDRLIEENCNSTFYFPTEAKINARRTEDLTLETAAVGLAGGISGGVLRGRWMYHEIREAAGNKGY